MLRNVSAPGSGIVSRYTLHDGNTEKIVLRMILGGGKSMSPA